MVLQRFDDEARRIILGAQREARYLQRGLVETSHLLLSIAAETDGEPAALLRAEKVTYDGLYFALIEMFIPTVAEMPRHLLHTPEFRTVLENAEREADTYGSQAVNPLHLLLGVLATKASVALGIVRMLGADVVRLRILAVASLTAA